MGILSLYFPNMHYVVLVIHIRTQIKYIDVCGCNLFQTFLPKCQRSSSILFLHNFELKHLLGAYLSSKHIAGSKIRTILQLRCLWVPQPYTSLSFVALTAVLEFPHTSF